jgi:predicted metal-dependent RNase
MQQGGKMAQNDSESKQNFSKTTEKTSQERRQDANRRNRKESFSRPTTGSQDKGIDRQRQNIYKDVKNKAGQRKDVSRAGLTLNTVRNDLKTEASGSTRSHEFKNQGGVIKNHFAENRAKNVRRRENNNVNNAVNSDAKLKIIPLGGLNEIGKNMTLLEWKNDIIIIDCGLAFPDDEMLGVDIVIPDITYLLKNASKIRGLFLTHAHEDHIGAIPYVFRDINIPIYATPLTSGIVKFKLEEYKMEKKVRIQNVRQGDM